MRTAIALLAALALTLSACGTATDAAGGDTAAGAQAGASTLEFAGTTVDGASYDGSQLAGKPAVLWFWAPWCPTCRAQAPAVETVAEQYDGQVSVLGVGGLSDADAIGEFARGVAGPVHLVDVDGDVWRHFGITEQSTYVLLDAEGGVVLEKSLGNEELAAEVADLVG